MSDRLKETFTELELDALHEMLNIAMGRAANAIACLMDVLVEMSLPKIRSGPDRSAIPTPCAATSA